MQIQISRSPLSHLTVTPSQSGAAGIRISDQSLSARAGFRGRHAAQFLTRQGFTLPDSPNQANWQADGSLVARLSLTEYLLLAGEPLAEQRVAQEESGWQQTDLACYLLPRRDTHAWLSLRGAHVSAMMAKLCAVDLSAHAFPPGAIAQTSVARANAIVINASRETEPELWLLVDTSMAAYFWSVLADAAAEFSPLQ